MSKKRAFISFDYDNDVDLKNLLVGQAKNDDSPFEIIDLSIKEAINSTSLNFPNISNKIIGLIFKAKNK